MRVIINIEKVYIKVFATRKGGHDLDEPIKTEPVEPKEPPKQRKTYKPQRKNTAKRRKEGIVIEVDGDKSRINGLSPKERKLLKSFQYGKEVDPYNND